MKKLYFLFFVLPLILFCGCTKDSKTNKDNKYSNYIGYINPEKALLNSKDTLFNKEKIYGTYSGAGLKAYKGSKSIFKKNILSKYNSQLYKDSGYISFRFLVNDQGKAGWFEVVEMNLDLIETNLDDKMVKELLMLTSKKENWEKLKHHKEEKIDYYMYILYRIENGKIIEILP